jgi:VIT1/CCC1 family predicted Fe2+/Mn2+ transporter
MSMAMGDYLSTKSEIEFQNSERKREEWEVENNPEGEKVEMQELYQQKGMSEEDAKLITNTLAKHKKAWVDVMMAEELGLLSSDENPVKNAIVTFISFVIFGIVPILPYIVSRASGLTN